MPCRAIVDKARTLNPSMLSMGIKINTFANLQLLNAKTNNTDKWGSWALLGVWSCVTIQIWQLVVAWGGAATPPPGLAEGKHLLLQTTATRRVNSTSWHQSFSTASNVVFDFIWKLVCFIKVFFCIFYTNVNIKVAGCLHSFTPQIPPPVNLSLANF